MFKKKISKIVLFYIMFHVSIYILALRLKSKANFNFCMGLDVKKLFFMLAFALTVTIFEIS